MNCCIELFFTCIVIVLQNMNFFVLGMEEYVDSKTASLFAQYECDKLKECTKGRGAVCAFDPNDQALVMFNDECLMHQANCKANGRYLFHSVDKIVCDTRTKYFNEHQGEEFEWQPITRSTPTTTNTSTTSTGIKGVTRKGPILNETTTAGGQSSKVVWMIRHRPGNRMRLQSNLRAHKINEKI